MYDGSQIRENFHFHIVERSVQETSLNRTKNGEGYTVKSVGVDDHCHRVTKFQ